MDSFLSIEESGLRPSYLPREAFFEGFMVDAVLPVIVDVDRIKSKVENELGLVVPVNSTSSKFAQYSQAYTSNLESLLSAHYWDFATEFTQLTRSVISPPFGYTYSYERPADFLKVIWLNSTGEARVDETPYQLVRNGKVYTNHSRVFLCYTAKVYNSELFSPLFRDALSLRIALELCLPFQQDKETSERLLARYKMLEFDSITVEHRDKGSNETLVNTSYNEARRFADTSLDLGPLGEPTVNIQSTPITL